MNKIFLMAMCVGLVFCETSDAGIVIDVGDHEVLANTAGQQIDILISSDPGDSMLSGMNLRARIGDGLGPNITPVFVGAPGSDDGFDIAGTIFAGGAKSGEGPTTIDGSVINGGVTTVDDREASGILISLLIDTTGFSAPGSEWTLELSNILGATELLGPVGNATALTGVIINDGMISFSVVPEPGSAVIFLAMGTVVAMRRKRR